MTWTQEEAIALCREIEAIAPEFDCHVALTGGALYKDGARKDCDILFYRVRQADKINAAGLFAALRDLGLDVTKHFGWCHKGTFQGKDVDLFFPEELKDFRQDCGEEADRYR